MAFLFRGQQIIARTLRSVGRSRSIRLAAAEAGATRSGRRHASAYFPEALKVVATAPNSLLFFSYFSSTVPAEMIKTMSPWRRAIIRTSIGPRSSEFIRRSASSAAPSLSSARCLATTVARSSKRSEEHTSELQSLAYLVCRLLLEKKKKLLLSNSDVTQNVSPSRHDRPLNLAAVSAVRATPASDPMRRRRPTAGSIQAPSSPCVPV